MEVTEKITVDSFADLRERCWSGARRNLSIPAERFHRGEITAAERADVERRAFDLLECMLAATLNSIDMTALNDFIMFDFFDSMKELNAALFEEFTGWKASEN